MPFQPGEIVFFKHPKHSWVLGKVSAAAPDPKVKGAFEYTCSADDAERQCVGETVPKIKEDDITSCREDLVDEEPNDLLSLTVLHDSTLLRCLFLRYMKDIIYTNIGAIVVALNPFNFKIPWYLDAKMPDYLAEGAVIEKNLPHSWAQAHNTYNEMMQDNMPQTILVSGESGAGKTEASKIVMKYLAAISNTRGTDEEKAAGLAVGTRLNACSPLLEAFGNARTVRNDNSSRFGKFMKIKFSTMGQLKGAFTIKYLLEKSRIVTAAENERIYHAFYIVVRGSFKDKLQIQPETQYKSLNAGKCLQNSEFNSAQDFQEVIESMGKIGMSQEAIDSTWATVVGVLSSQNISFLEDGEGSKVADADKKIIADLGRLWKVDVVKLEKEFTTTTLVIAGDRNTKLLRPVMAVDVRDALSKSLYNGLFGWLVEKCNELCDDPAANGSWIGLLDIFGFEDFTYNSFEQLCINLANETLQNHYNSYIFDKDMAECRAEGVDVADIKCPDNKPCLRLITAPGGIMALLDEECSLGKGSDLSFLEKIDQAHGNSKNPFFDKKKTSRDTFIVNHYAASVTYTVTGWLEKNRDTIKDDIRLILRASEDPNVAGFLEAPIPIDQQKGKKVTVGGFFKDQVNQLMDVINSTNPHWIRCIKPHPAKKPKMFDGVQTLNQLESSGVLGTVKIRKAGYPIRTIFTKFNMRYRILLPGGKSKGDEREASAQILTACQMDNPKFAQIGKTKVFMKSEAFPLIERKRNDLLAVAGVTLQRVGRAYLQRKETNANWCKEALKVAAKTIVIEYREYLRRSKAVREERARLRREAELKFRGLRTALQEQMEKEKAEIFAEFSRKTFEFVDQRNQAIEAEKARLEYFRGARELFARQESMARIRLYEEFAAHLSYLSELYFKEISVFYEIEALFAVEAESHQRGIIESDEAANRNRIWRSYVESQSRGIIESIAAEGINSKRLWYAAEELQRAEIYGRLSIARTQIQMRKHFRRQLATVGEEAKRYEMARLEYEAAQGKEIRHYERLRAKEIAKLDAEAAEVSALMGNTNHRGGGGGGMFDANGNRLYDNTPMESDAERMLFHESKAAASSGGAVPPLLRCAPDDLNPFSPIGAERLRQASAQRVGGGGASYPAATPTVGFGFGTSNASSYHSPQRSSAGGAGSSANYSHLQQPSSPLAAAAAASPQPHQHQQHQQRATSAYAMGLTPRGISSVPSIGGGGGGGGVGAFNTSSASPLSLSMTNRGGGGGASGGAAPSATSASDFLATSGAAAYSYSSAAPPHPRSGAGIATSPTTTTPFNYLHNTASGPHQGRPAYATQQQQMRSSSASGGAAAVGNSHGSAILSSGSRGPHAHAATGTMTYPEAIMRSLQLGGSASTAAGDGGASPRGGYGGYGQSSPAGAPSSAYRPSSAFDPNSTTNDLMAYVANSASSLAARNAARNNAALYGVGGGGVSGSAASPPRAASAHAPPPLSSMGGSAAPSRSGFSSGGAMGMGGGGYGGSAAAAAAPSIHGSSGYYGGGRSGAVGVAGAGGFGLFDISSPSPKPVQQMYRGGGGAAAQPPQQSSFQRQPSPAGGARRW